VSERHLAWFGIGIGLIGAGLPLVFPQSIAHYIGGGLLVGGVVVCGSVLWASSVYSLRLRGRRQSTAKVVDWLHRVADHGTKHIQNARVRSGEQVVTELRPAFDTWNAIVVDGTKPGLLTVRREAD
jgi:hypothetical protein